MYQFEITDDDLIAGGITAADLLAMNHGTFVWTLDSGRWSFTQTAPNPEGNATDEGTYSIDGGQVTVTFPSLSIIEVYSWTRTDDGDLVLTPVDADPVGTVLMTAKPWERIGDPPADEPARRGARQPEGTNRTVRSCWCPPVCRKASAQAVVVVVVFAPVQTAVFRLATLA